MFADGGVKRKLETGMGNATDEYRGRLRKDNSLACTPFLLLTSTLLRLEFKRPLLPKPLPYSNPRFRILVRKSGVEHIETSVEEIESPSEDLVDMDRLDNDFFAIPFTVSAPTCTAMDTDGGFAVPQLICPPALQEKISTSCFNCSSA
jgi:hypothetical protein